MMIMRKRMGTRGFSLWLLLAGVVPAQAAVLRPVVKPRVESHKVARRVSVQDAPVAKGKEKPHAKPLKPGTKSAKSSGKPSGKSAAKPAMKGKRRRGLRPEEQAENEPIPLSRTGARSFVRKGAGVRPAKIAVEKVVAAPAPVHAGSVVREGGVGEDVLGAVAVAAREPGARKRASTADFLKAAGASKAEVKAESFEQGESHPEDEDERLPVRRGSGVGAAASVEMPVVSAAPVPVTPVGKVAMGATLPEKVHAAAVKVEAAAKADVAKADAALATRKSARAAKPQLMPEENAAKEAVIAEAMLPPVSPVIYGRGGRLMVPAALKGTHEILVHQNVMADAQGLTRIQDDEDLNRMRAHGVLVALGSSAALTVNPELPVNRRYARPWAAKFVAETAAAFYAKFHEPLRLNSAVRTVAYQVRLQRVNGNAAGIDGENASPHLTGQAIDFGKRGMSMAEIAWMRAYLGPLMQAGKIDVEEEFQQACFHVSVYPAYVKVRPVQVAGLRRPMGVE